MNSQSLSEWPKDLSADCEKLELYANAIKKVPPSVGDMKKLKLINCFNNKIGLSLPAEIGTLSELEEVNFAANKLAMLKDVNFASWGNVTILSLNDNNLGSIGSLAPLVKLEELRLFANNLEAMPTLNSHPDLKVFEIHKNRVKEVADDYFKATPALERLSIWGNQLTALPTSLTGCASLVGVQAYSNPELASLPAGPWPATLETLFVQETKITKLPDSLKACAVRCTHARTARMHRAHTHDQGGLSVHILCIFYAHSVHILCTTWAAGSAQQSSAASCACAPQSDSSLPAAPSPPWLLAAQARQPGQAGARLGVGRALKGV